MERKPRKKNKKLTIMLIPHSDSAIRSLKIPMWIINSLAFFGVISLIVVTYLAFAYIDYRITAQENKELKVINKAQAKEIENLQNTTKETLKRLEEIIETETKIRELVGLKESENKKPSRGQGGLGLERPSVQTLAVNEEEVLEIEEVKINIKKSNKLNNIKEDLKIIDELINEQSVVLEKLEKDVKKRLDFLASIPSGWPVRGRITSDYGWRRNPFNHKTWEYHEGIDIATSYGTPIRAAGAGKVIFTGWKPVYGRTVVIKHGYGYISQYAHNSKINVKVGQNVKRGDIIARVGSTGRSTGPHLDFRINFNGHWIDPLKILKK